MTNKKSRADQFSLIIHGQEGEGEAKEALLGKEGAYVCGTHPVLLSKSYPRISAAAIAATRVRRVNEAAIVAAEIQG